LRLIETTGYTFGIGAATVGLGLYSYSVRELLASLFLFSAAFFFLGLLAAGLFTIWSASEQLANWSVPASRNATAFSRRLIAAHARP
jgi:hypothetical protein